MHVLVVILLLAGLLFFTGGTVGILRFPDFYTRLHASGKMDTLGVFLVGGALALAQLEEFNALNLLTALKIFLIVGFVFMSSPTATHAILDAGLRAGLGAWDKTVSDEERA